MLGTAAVPPGKPAAKKSTAKQKTQTAKPAPPKSVGAAGLIAVAQNRLELKNYTAAVTYATSAASTAPILADYAHYIRAQAEFELHNNAELSASAARIFTHAPLSPFVGPVAALVVQADLSSDRPKQALEMVKKYFDVIPQPQADLLLARCYRSTGDLLQAAEYYRRVYYEYPTA